MSVDIIYDPISPEDFEEFMNNAYHSQGTN
jgi:hypothetical protein